MDPYELYPISGELIESIIEKLRLELILLAEKYQYNFQNNEVIAASIKMDQWLNLFEQSFIQEKDKLKN
jgi:hypothetical protein